MSREDSGRYSFAAGVKYVSRKNDVLKHVPSAHLKQLE
jgi:hypothetical protein